MYILFSILTSGIYHLVCFYNIGADLNRIAGRFDGQKTRNYVLISLAVYVTAFLFTFLGLMLVWFVDRWTMFYVLRILILAMIAVSALYCIWHHQLSKRIGRELWRRGIVYPISASTYWLWSVLGSFILVGRFIYTHKLFTAMNLLSASYNANDVFVSPQNPFQHMG